MKLAEEQLLTDCFEQLIEECKTNQRITVEKIFFFFSHKGYPALIALLSIPFCFPIPPPGFSTLFGGLLFFLGLRYAFAQKPWWPNWVMKKQFECSKVLAVTQKSVAFIYKMKHLVRPRLLFFTSFPLAHRIHGLTICALSFLLALPLPIPFSNIAAAAPIVLISIGILENDGILLLIGYFISLLCLLLFAFLIAYSSAQLNHFLSNH